MSTENQTPTYPKVRPATDILEREDGFHIYMDLPGVKKDDLVIDLNENELRISAVAVHPAQVETDALSMEFGSGEYVRSFTLADAVDREGIAANFSNGVLEIHLPRVERIQPKRIEIQAG